MVPKGSAHYNYKGGMKIDHKGYVLILNHGHPRADCKGYVREHLLVAERALGRPIPLRHPVHHVNENKGDNSNSNLVICENQSYHQLIHIRTKVFSLGGNPNTDKFCIRCKKVFPCSSFGPDSTRRDGLRYQCKPCASEIMDLCRAT